MAHASAALQVVGAVVGAARQTLEHLLIHVGAVDTLPAGLAETLSGHALSVPRTGRVQAVLCGSEQIKTRKFRPTHGLKFFVISVSAAIFTRAICCAPDNGIDPSCSPSSRE